LAGINTGILSNAYPLTANQIKELEKRAVEKQEATAYLNENGELCFALPFGVDDIARLAWNNAYEISRSDDTLFKKAYKKSGIDSFYLDTILTKHSWNDDWRAQHAVSIFENEFGGLTYEIQQTAYTITENAAGGLTYTIGE
jgi:hypothetical protein